MTYVTLHRVCKYTELRNMCACVREISVRKKNDRDKIKRTSKCRYLHNIYTYSTFWSRCDFFLVFLLIIPTYSFNNNAIQDQCDDLFSLDVYEIDISKFVSGTNEEKKQIAGIFDRAFHQYGIIRLINTNLTSEIIDKTKEFFALDKEAKMKYYVNGSYYETPGYKPPGLEAVANYKGDKKASATDSNEVFFTLFKAQSKEFNFPIDQTVNVFREVIPAYILQGRQLIFYLHQIADLALGLNENTFDKNYTSDHATFLLRLAKYFPPKNDEQLSLGEHQDYLGFTLIQNDDVPGT